MMKRLLYCLLLSFLLVPAFCQETEKRWKFLIEPYLMFPAMDGEIGIRNLPSAEVDANPRDIFSNLTFGGMLYFEAHSPSWAITSDVLYMNLQQDISTTTLINSGEAKAEQLMYELAGFYRIAPFLEAGLGGRINSIGSDLALEKKVVGGTESVSGSLSETWFDPIIITRLSTDVNEKWLFVFRGDFGGFGVGSTFTWQVQGYVGYKFTRIFQTSVGYRILGMDYDQGKGENRFRYNVNTFGPNIRFGFNL